MTADLQDKLMRHEQDVLSPEIFVFAAAIGATPRARRILSTLGIRRNGAGALPALRTAARAAEAAVAAHPSNRAQEWTTVFRDLSAQTAAMTKRAAWLEALCPVVTVRTVADALGNPARSTLPKEARERLDAWLGIHLFHALSRDCVLSTSILDDWDTLRRTGAPRSNTPHSWISAAKHMPLEPTEVNKLLISVRNTRLQAALKVTLAALAADLPDPASLTFQGSEAEGATQVASAPGQEHFADDETEECDDCEPDNHAAGDRTGADVIPPEQASEMRESLIGLLVHRAFHGGYRGHFGVTGIYGELPTPDLQRTCHALVATQATGTERERTFAAVAEISLKLSLSPRRTLSLALRPNNDVWLDLGAGTLCWNFDLVRDARERRSDDEGTKDPSVPIPIRLSDLTVLRLREIDNGQTAAGTLQELVNVPVASDTTLSWLKEYGHFLRAHGDSNYKAYAVRFARSYRCVYLDRGHGAVMAAFLALDFCTAPPGLLHYISVSQSQLTDCQHDVDNYLGLRWTSTAAEGC